MKKVSIKNCLAAGALLLAVAAIPGLAQGPGDQVAPPIDQWTKGDWWEVKLEQMALYARSESTDWRESFLLRFDVTDATKKEAKVVVTTVPENRFNEKLLLSYNHKGELTSAEVVDPERKEPLGEGGSPGVFGMLGREAFDLSSHPKDKKGNGNGPQVRVEVGKKGKAHQKWEPGDAFWTEFETEDELPQRGKRVKGEWSKKKK